MHYRADIDGLRAVAVVAVMLFHAGLGLPGGFVGVDVFFVISGFLITGLIIRDLNGDSFSLQRFWQRRICRIWPAALAMTTATLAAAWGFFLPDDYKLLAGDAIAHVCMLANVHYVNAADYFAPNSDLRPLLHTWSLAVEEQFYLVFPFVMFGLHRLGRPMQTLIVCSAMGCSFVASEWAIQRSCSEAFYLLPYRAWELLLGSLIAIRPPPIVAQRWCREALGILGFAAIVIPMWIYGRTTSFPGTAAIPPCVGTAALILAGGGGGCVVSSGLATRPLKAVGQVSYSLYLWHWPVLAMLRYVHGIDLPTSMLLAASMFTALIAALSWRFIETPFREAGNTWTSGMVFAAASIASIAIIAAAVGIRMTNGASRRFHPDVATFTTQSEARPTRSTEADPTNPISMLAPLGASCAATERPCFLLWGDSHAMAICQTVNRLATDAGLSGYAMLNAAAPPIPGAWRPGDHRGEAARKNASLLHAQMGAWIASRKPRNVILCARWSRYLEGGLADNGEEFLIGGVADTLSRVRDRESAGRVFEAGLAELAGWCEQAGAELWFLCEVPYQPITPPQRALRAALARAPVSVTGVDAASHRHYTQRVTLALENIASVNMHVVDLAVPFFADNGISLVGRDGHTWYWDDDHINDRGADEALGRLLERLLGGLACPSGVAH